MEDNIKLDTDLVVAQLMPVFGEKMGKLMADMFEAKIKELGLDKVDRKNGMFPGLAEDPNDTPAERSRQFFRAVLFGKTPTHPAIIKALSEGTASAGGYLVPDEVKAEIILWAAPLSELYPFVRKMPVITDAGNMPAGSSGVSVTWDNSGHENVGFTESDPVFGQVAWIVYRMNALTKMSREVANDSNPNIVNVVKQLFAEAIAEERDKMIAIGTNTNQPKGIYSETGLSTVAFGGAVTYAKLVELQYKLARRYQKGAGWCLNSTILGDCRALVSTTNQPIIYEGLTVGEPATMLGKAIHVQDDLPDHTILYGDLSKYIWYDREQMGLETTTEGGDAFANHQLWVKVWERCDGSLSLAGTGKLGSFVKATGITT